MGATITATQERAWKVAMKNNPEGKTDAYYGYLDAVAGVFDKCYKVRREDKGREYLRGWNAAVTDKVAAATAKLQAIAG